MATAFHVQNDVWRLRSNWLVNLDHDRVRSQCIQYQQDLHDSFSHSTDCDLQPRVLIATSDPETFIAGFLAAINSNWAIALGNPHWAEAEWQQALEILQPRLVWGERGERREERGVRREEGGVRREERCGSQVILIPTGGSSGQLRFVVQTLERLTASVQGFQNYFQVDAVNAVCVLPLYHVSGFMQVLRSLFTGGQLAIVPFKTLEAGHIPDLDPENYFLSLVPTQLQRLIQASTQLPHLGSWLKQLSTILLGGAPAWPDLLTTARSLQLRIAPTYGMTETASQVVTLHPEDFLQGVTGCGSVLPHAQVAVIDDAGQPLPPGQIGQIALQAQSLARGYLNPGGWESLPTVQLRRKTDNSGDGLAFCTDDLGYFDAQDRLHIQGRSSYKIITGGEKVFPEEVEAVLRASEEFQDLCVLGLSDPIWGQAVTVAYVSRKAGSAQPSPHLLEYLQRNLSKFKHPKRWVQLTSLPRNAQGKVNRVGLQQLLKQQGVQIGDRSSVAVQNVENKS